MMDDQCIRNLATSTTVTSALTGVTASNGLLYRCGVLIQLPEADHLANMCGLICCEQLVRILEKK